MKRKSKNRSVARQTLWDDVLFSTKFSIETTHTPVQCAAILKKIKNSPASWSNRWKIVDLKVTTQLDEISFQFEASLYRTRNNLVASRATGMIYADNRGKTLIEGAARFGLSSYFFSLLITILTAIAVLLFYLNIQQQDSSWMRVLCNFFGLLALIGSSLYMWYTQFNERNKLIREIRIKVINDYD